MNNLFFAHNVAAVQQSFPLSIEVSLPSAQRVRDVSAGIFQRSIALAALVAASPVILTLAALTRLTSRGPAFYGQTRVGKEGKFFRILKLRTMVEGAERTTGAVLSWSGDPRVTKLGGFLRKTHLDELPQLVNIVRGEMGFIGPRPERPEFVNQFRAEVPNYSLRLNVKPGVTGLAQICCPYDVSVHEKLHYDLIYLVNRGSFRLAFFILSRTLLKVAQLD